MMKKTAMGFFLMLYLLVINVPFSQANPVDYMVRKAQFIFEGTVVDVQFRVSQNAKGEPTLNPYTFVTYKVHRIMKGNYNSDLLTLRFIGGIDEQGVVFAMEGTPRFDLGDHDLLLVGNNNYSLCPLVNCSQGRFRFIQGLVVNEYGQLIELNENSLKLGQAIDLDEVSFNKMGAYNFRRRDVKQVDGEEIPIAIPREKANTGLVPDVAGFSSYIEQKVYENHDLAELVSQPLFETADPNKPFRDELLERIYTPVADPAPVETIEKSAVEKDKQPTDGASNTLTAEVSSADKDNKNRADFGKDASFSSVTPTTGMDSNTSIYTYALIVIMILSILATIAWHRAKKTV